MLHIIILSRSIHAVTKGKISFFFQPAVFHCQCSPAFFSIQSSTHGHLGCFHTLLAPPTLFIKGYDCFPIFTQVFKHRNGLTDLFFLRSYLFIFREGKGRRKRGRETSMCGCLSHAPYWGSGLQPSHVPETGSQTSDPLVHRPALNPLSHTSQGWWSFSCGMSKHCHYCLPLWLLRTIELILDPPRKLRITSIF